MKKIYLSLLLVAVLIGHVSAQFRVSGSVSNAMDESLPGATIAVQGTELGAVVDANGKFSISLDKGSYTLIASFVGYQATSKKVTVSAELTVSFVLSESAVLVNDLVVLANRIDNKTPIAHTDVTKSELESHDQGKDLPILLGFTPSMVTTSDAGAGIGYTDLRVRGSNIARINVTINGVPLNDPESHGVFWVNMPDFAGSIENVQIQRGVGSSSDGAAAFGASINLQTVAYTAKPYTELSASYGSFNSQKQSIRLGTGLLPNKLAFNVRLSQIASDGFIDRSFSDLKSYFVSGGYFGEKTSVRFSATTGKERTYQAWYGIPKFKLNNDKAGIEDFIAREWLSDADAANLRSANPRTYNYYTYDNETDNYQQDRYELVFSQLLTPELKWNTTFFYTHGEGFYEQSKKDKKLADYGLPNVDVDGTLIKRTDLIQQKWLDNDLLGFNTAFDYTHNNLSLKVGGSYNTYDGNHFGKVIWARTASVSEINHEWYRGTGVKSIYSAFAITRYALSQKLHAFLDLQYRGTKYKISGDDDDLKGLNYDLSYDFFNPKAGLYYQATDALAAYASYSRANREPNRANIIDVAEGKKPNVPETLNDFEVGSKYQKGNLGLEMNVYYMAYKDQLVLSGVINDVGSALMQNVDKSYRLGVEMSWAWQIVPQLRWEGNLALSENKIIDYQESISEYSEYWDAYIGEVKGEVKTTDISLSPSVVFHNTLTASLLKGLDLSLATQYVSRQYLDNTSTKYNSLDPYLVNDLSLSYNFKTLWFENVSLSLSCANLLDTDYETNGYIAKYIIGGVANDYDGYYPQAGRHYMLGATFRF